MSKLPKTDFPTSTFEVPTNKDQITLRPMKVSDEKILLMAKESRSALELFKATRQVLNNCIVGEYDLSKLALVDINYLWIKLRTISLGDKVQIQYNDEEDNRLHVAGVDLSKIEIKWNTQSPKIKMTDANSLVLRIPSNDLYLSEVFDKEDVSAEELMETLVIGVLDSYHVGKEVYDLKTLSHEEAVAFVDDLDVKTHKAVKEFIVNLPSIYLTSKYTNSMGTERKFEYKTLNDFFILP